jgi:hypothetical protein
MLPARSSRSSAICRSAWRISAIHRNKDKTLAADATLFSASRKRRIEPQRGILERRRMSTGISERANQA